jgi:c-di-GMP-binding flagellar brake protein YcgR
LGKIGDVLMVDTKKGYLTYDSENKSVRAVFFHETTNSRIKITLNGQTIEHVYIPEDIIKEIVNIGGIVTNVHTPTIRPRNIVFGIPVEIVHQKKLHRIRIRITGSSHEEIISKISKIKNELMKFGVKYVTCNWDSTGLYPVKESL